MSLKRYNVDLRKLSLNEREKVYDILEKQSFITTIDLKNIGVYEVFWDSSTPIEESITFPSESIITQI
ncbi:hypothetical protein DVV81_08325 [Clostridium botulinum]|uniref:hypothetical protein n=1 Tax=Clostridium botulinum TaxID=1491 RepID=UPI001966F938|nr:hypothetical protein [Clostridium botulinum]MBN1071175.1 hypothetical protein [Clostridium botulinum]